MPKKEVLENVKERKVGHTHTHIIAYTREPHKHNIQEFCPGGGGGDDGTAHKHIFIYIKIDERVYIFCINICTYIYRHMDADL